MKKLIMTAIVMMSLFSTANAYEGAFFVGGGLSLLDSPSVETKYREPLCKWSSCGTRLVVDRQQWDREVGLSLHFAYGFRPSQIMILGTVTRYEGGSADFRPSRSGTGFEAAHRGPSWAFGVSVLGRID